MANGFKSGGRDFEPGQSGNPDGRPPVPADLREARLLNRIEVERLLNDYLRMTLPEMKARFQNPATPAIEAIIAKICFEAISRGDEKRLGFILDRTIGPVKIIVRIEDVPNDALAAEAERRGLKLVSSSDKGVAKISDEQLLRLVQLARGKK